MDVTKDIVWDDEEEFLFNQISELKDPKDIKIIEKYQNKQHKLGAWVEGIFPDQFVDNEITIPDSLSNKNKCVSELIEQKKKNLDAIKAMGEYNLYFKNKELELTGDHKDYPENWNLEIDLNVLSQTIEFLQSKNVSKKRAKEIANLKGNQEMLKHRKNLGYLPDPITDTEDLAELLMWAASNKPEDIIWKWLSPLNIFELSDINNNLDKFEELDNIIDKHREEITSNILSKISGYIKNDLKFTETFSLTFGFAIRGWATDNRFGVNIENIKDNYDRLIATIAHELFHRLQTRICAADGQSHTFFEIVSGNLADEKDNKFYEVLSYIMLEGTGEFITHQFTGEKQDDLQKKADEGLDLLNETYEFIYKEGELEKVDELLGKGLKSNGVFYSLGEFMTENLVEIKGKSYLGEILQKGVGSFFVEGLNGVENLNNEKILDKVKEII